MRYSDSLLSCGMRVWHLLKKKMSCFNSLHITFDWTWVHSSLCVIGYRFGWWHTLDVNAAVLATNLTDGAHGPHVAFISWAVLGWGQQRFGVEKSFGVQGVQASIDWNLTHRTQITVAPDLQLWGVLRWYPGEVTMGRRSQSSLHKFLAQTSCHQPYYRFRTCSRHAIINRLSAWKPYTSDVASVRPCFFDEVLSVRMSRSSGVFSIQFNMFAEAESDIKEHM